MKRTITILLAAVFSVGLCFAESWPDGSKMDKWFTSGPEKIKGQQAKRYVITDYGVVKDSTVLQTTAIQKIIDMVSEKGGGTIVVP